MVVRVSAGNVKPGSANDPMPLARILYVLNGLIEASVVALNEKGLKPIRIFPPTMLYLFAIPLSVLPASCGCCQLLRPTRHYRTGLAYTRWIVTAV
jgi:hypothetical protein